MTDFSDEGVNKIVQISPGVFVEEDVLGVVDWIRNYASSLDVVYLDNTRADVSPNSPPYVIVEHCLDGVIRIVMRCWTLDDRVKAAIISADTQCTDVLSTLDAQNRRVRDAQERAFKDSVDEAHDVALHIFKNPKTTYRFRNMDGELIILDDEKGVKRASD